MKPLAVLFLLVFGAFALAQDNPVEIRLETYVVSVVTTEDGNREERFNPATTARPGQVVEYRLFVVNVSAEVLPAGIVVITAPVPEGTTFVDNSATPSSERVVTEFSIDGGENFKEPPITVDGQPAGPESIDAVRWTLMVDFEPEAEEVFFYRVTVDR